MNEHSIRVNPGDTVVVPWGLDTVTGTVRESYFSAGVQRIRVAVDIPGADPEEVVLRAEDLISASGKSDYSNPGGWLRYGAYEAEVLEALKSAATRLTAHSVDVEVLSRRTHSDGRYDAVVTIGRLQIVIEVKWNLSFLPRIVDQMHQFLITVMNESDASVAGLIVSPNALRLLAENDSKGYKNVTTDIAVVQWRGHDDDSSLAAAIRHLAASRA